MEALSMVSPTNLAVMQPAIPVFTMGLSVVFGMENLTILKAFGMAMAVAGAITIEVVKPGGGNGGRSAQQVVLGNILVVMQVKYFLSHETLIIFGIGPINGEEGIVVTSQWYVDLAHVAWWWWW